MEERRRKSKGWVMWWKGQIPCYCACACSRVNPVLDTQSINCTCRSALIKRAGRANHQQLNRNTQCNLCRFNVSKESFGILGTINTFGIYMGWDGVICMIYTRRCTMKWQETGVSFVAEIQNKCKLVHKIVWHKVPRLRNRKTLINVASTNFIYIHRINGNTPIGTHVTIS